MQVDAATPVLDAAKLDRPVKHDTEVCNSFPHSSNSLMGQPNWKLQKTELEAFLQKVFFRNFVAASTCIHSNSKLIYIKPPESTPIQIPIQSNTIFNPIQKSNPK